MCFDAKILSRSSSLVWCLLGLLEPGNDDSQVPLCLLSGYMSVWWGAMGGHRDAGS